MAITGQRPNVLTMALPHTPEAAGTARHAVRDVLEKRGWPDELVENAMLVVSELVTNAVVHGLPPVELRMRVVSGFAAGRVTDRSPELPVPAEAEADGEGDGEGGLGLAIVAAVAAAWGAHLLPERGGKAVWFEFRGPPDPAPAPRPSPGLRLWGVPGPGGGPFRGTSTPLRSAARSGGRPEPS
ncbi:ATP-binding protein [Nonomuraea longicatena]|uniref:Histidine kinase/HSP90-like ATPase domain-containing protein n=1 Tax=Nonomuraea longicatena TaxID=83682 RepID=A0ABP4BEX5_9ACTN